MLTICHKLKKLLLLFYLNHCLAYAQSIRYTPGTLYTGVGAYSRAFTQSFSFLSYQAALGNINRTSAGIYAKQQYGLKQLATYMATAALPVYRGGIGISAQYAGFNDFNESAVSLAYGKSLGSVSVGVQCNYYMLHLAGYGNDAAIGVEVGSQWQITKQLYTGVHLVNPVGGRYKNASAEKLAPVYEWGWATKLPRNYFWACR